MLAALVPAMLVIAQPDLGSGMVYMVIAFVMLLVAGDPVAASEWAGGAGVRVRRGRAGGRRQRSAYTC